MKRLFAVLALIFLLSGSINGLVFAKGGSGGGATDSGVNAAEQAQQAAEQAAAAKAAQEAAAQRAADEAAAAKAKAEADAAAKAAQQAAAKTEADAAAKAAAEKAAQASKDKAAAEKAAQQAADKAKAQEEAAAAAKAKADAEREKILEASKEIEHCGKKEAVKERIKCRLTADQATLDAEYADNYLPEACWWKDKSRPNAWNEQWKSDCTMRYIREQVCWSDATSAGSRYRAQDVMDCLKPILNLPEKLVPVAQYCADKGEDCEQTYRENVYHLIVGRFYDAEERVEVLYDREELTLEQTSEALEWITQHKKDFYSAKNKAGRVAVINSFKAQWEELVSSLQ